MKNWQCLKGQTFVTCPCVSRVQVNRSWLLLSCRPCLRRELIHFKRDRDWMSEWKWYQDRRDNIELENEKWALSLVMNDEGSEETTVQSHLLRRGQRGGCQRGENRPFCGMALSFVCLFLFREPRWTTLGHPAPWEAAREGRASKGLGSDWRQGKLWLLSGSPWRLLLCLSCTPRQLPLILPLFFCSEPFSPRTIATGFFKEINIFLAPFLRKSLQNVYFWKSGWGRHFFMYFCWFSRGMPTSSPHPKHAHLAHRCRYTW